MSLYSLNPVTQANFSVIIKLDSLRFRIWTNGIHPLTPSDLHSHRKFEVQTALAGEYRVDFEDRMLQVGAPDTLCLIPPNRIHKCSHSSGDAMQIGLHFTVEQKAAPSPLADAVSLLPAQDPVLLTDCVPLCETLRAFAEELQNPGPASELLLEVLLQKFFILLLRRLQEQTSVSERIQPEYNPQADRYNAIETFFHTRYQSSITENDLAEALSVSKRHTSRLLRQIYGKSFHEKLEEIRMHYALQYLLQTDLPIEQVAYRIGYASASGFFVAFKKSCRMTPTEYRRSGV